MATPEELRAQRMQEQYNQPVYGPRNPPAQAQPLPVWAQGDIGGPLYRVGTGLAGATAPAPNAMMAGRFGSAPTRPSATAATPEQTAGTAAAIAGGAANTAISRSVAQSTLDPNPSIRAAQVDGNRVADIAALSPENQAVIAQDRANLKQSVDALNKNFDQSNQLIKRADAMTKGPTYANKRGEYSMTGTSPDVIADARRRSYTGSGGVNFGFAPGEARQYLDKMAAQDRADREQWRREKAETAAAVERIGLRNAMERGNLLERRAARLQMEALDARMNLGTQQLGETTRQRISTAGDIQRAGLAAQASEAGSEMDAMSRLQAAQITGEYGLAGEQVRADVTANDPDSIIKQHRVSLALAALQSGDNEAANRYLNGLSAPSTPAPKMQYTQDATGRPTGVWVNGAWRPLTPQEQEGVTRVNAGYTPAQN